MRLNITIFLDSISYFLDLFKVPFSLNFSSDKKLISTKFGSLISILIISYIISEIFNSNMYQRTNPTVSTENLLESIRPKIGLKTRKNFELSMGLFDINLQNFVIDPRFYEIKLTQNYRQLIVRANDSKLGDIVSNSTNYGLDVCPDDYYNVSSGTNVYKNMVCLQNAELVLEGYLNEILFSYVTVDLNYCNNDTNNGSCASLAEIKNDIQGKFFAIYYSDFNILYQDLNNPIFATPETQYIMLDSNYFKMVSIFLKKFEFYDDSSYLIADSQITDGFTTDTIATDFSMGGKDLLISRFTLFSSQPLQKSQRRYQKITEVFSSIGGSASLLISIGFFFVNILINWEIRLQFFRNLFEFYVTRTTIKDSANIQKSKASEMIHFDKEEQYVGNKQLVNDFQKLNPKTLKNDSFILENYSKETLNEEKGNENHRQEDISLFKHVRFKIKRALGFKLNDVDRVYQILDEKFSNNITGDFLYKKFQELDCFKQIVLDSEQILLVNNIQRPKLEMEIGKLTANFKKYQNGLFPSFKGNEKIVSKKIKSN